MCVGGLVSDLGRAVRKGEIHFPPPGFADTPSRIQKGALHMVKAGFLVGAIADCANAPVAIVRRVAAPTEFEPAAHRLLARHVIASVILLDALAALRALKHAPVSAQHSGPPLYACHYRSTSFLQ